MPPSSCPSNNNPHHNQQHPHPHPQPPPGHPSSSSSGGGEEAATTPPRSSSSSSLSSWFSSWFENDPQQAKKQIHDTLNDLEAYQERYARYNPFFFPPPHVPTASNTSDTSPTGSALQREMEEFLESAGLGGFFAPDAHQWTSRFGTTNHIHPPHGTTSTTGTSMAYQILRQENPQGVHLEVQFPSTIDPEQVTVQVVESDPSSCIVQWRHAPVESGSSSSGIPTFRDQARLGTHIDCSQLSASISMSQKKLVVQAPTESATTTSSSSGSGSSNTTTPRRIHVTEQGGNE